MTLSLDNPLLLIPVSALGYALATVAMKGMAGNPSALMLIAIATLFAVAIGVEILVLRKQGIAFTYVAILALEALVLIAIALAFGETMQPREWLGAGVILLGVALLWA